MGPNIIARNYADTLLALARRHGGEAAVDEYGRALEEVAELLRREPQVREFLETPRVGLEAKQQALRASFTGRVPDLFLHFLLVVVEKRRQALLENIARQYEELVDQARNRVRAEVTVARPADPELQREIVATLERRTAKTVIATFQVDPSIMGGMVVRVQDQILDGSLRSRIGGLRRRLLEARLPAATGQSSL